METEDLNPFKLRNTLGKNKKETSPKPKIGGRDRAFSIKSIKELETPGTRNSMVRKTKDTQAEDYDSVKKLSVIS